MSKQRFILLSTLLFAITAIGQEVALKAFNSDQYLLEAKKDASYKDPVYHYMVTNYKAISTKEKIPSNGVGDCGFKQSFENGFAYIKRNCGDANLPNGEVLVIPNPDRSSILIWVESLNKIHGDYDQNQWNFDQSIYQPTGGLPGAYFEVRRELDCTTILVMSGC